LSRNIGRSETRTGDPTKTVRLELLKPRTKVKESSFGSIKEFQGGLPKLGNIPVDQGSWLTHGAWNCMEGGKHMKEMV